LDTDAVITVAVTFVVLCVCPLLAGWIAERKGRQVLPWALLGIIGGVFAILVVALMPRVETVSLPSGQEPI
jgi:MFS family permease